MVSGFLLHLWLRFALQDYKADEDPALFHSVKTKRGPLGPNWKVLAADLADKWNLDNIIIDRSQFLKEVVVFK